MSWFGNPKSNCGQTILEVVIALAIFIFISASLSALILGGANAALHGSEQTEASAIAQEGLEALRSIRNGAWNELAQSPAGVLMSGGQWIISGVQNSIPPFTRILTLLPVCRSIAGDIATCPGTMSDPHTVRAVSTVSWTTAEGAANQAVHSSYLTNWDALRWIQTDWGGGAGQAVFLAQNRYESDDGRVNVQTAGHVQLATAVGSGSWLLHSEINPPGHHLQDVWALTATDAWAVGDDGLILHYNGTVWSIVPAPHGDRINAIHMLSATSGWAVGDGGHIIRYNGSSWSSVSSPSTDHLNGVFMVSETDGWAVGDAGKILRYNGSSWSEFTDTGGNAWYDVGLTSATDGWAVGNQGLIYRWNGTAWSPHTDSGGTVWRTIHMLSATDGFAAGDQGLIYRWNGTTWSLSVDTGGTNWRSINLASVADGWVTGTGGDIYRWNGSAWTSYVSPTTSDINGVFMLSSSRGWAVGNQAKVFQYLGTAYETSGSLTSSAFSLADPSPVTVIEWDEVMPSCTPSCDVRLQVRTAPDSGGAPGVFGSWYGDNGADTFFSSPSGSMVTSAVNGNRWAQYRIFLDGDGFETPLLNEVRIYYK